MTMSGFLEKLRKADEGVKMRWIILFTSIAMVIVIYVWLAYFNTLFATLNTSSAVAEDQTGAPQQKAAHPSPTFLERMGSAYQAFTDAFGGIFKLQKEYVIRPN